VQGARQIRDKIPREELVIIFVNAGSWDEMEARIRARAPISETELAKRKERYQDEMGFMPEADFIIENHAGQVESAKQKFAGVVSKLITG
jgi:guanylate kinase